MPEEKPRDTAARLAEALKKLLSARDDDNQLDPMMRAIKAVHSVTATGSTSPEDLERQRAGQELFARLVTPAIGVTASDYRVGAIPAEWVRLDSAHDRRHIILYCHGGGYTCGQLGYARILASKLALATGLDTFSFEYRLAPEHPYPAAVQDALEVWDHLMYLGYGAREVVVAGDSAGGNLALELCLKLKEQGRRQPRLLVLMSPWTDMTCTGLSHTECADIDPMLDAEYIASVREAYTGPDADWADPCFSPLFGDLRGLPTALIQVGTNEILRSDAELLHHKLIESGGYSTLEVYEDCWHVFQQMPIRRAAQAMDSVARFVQKNL